MSYSPATLCMKSTYNSASVLAMGPRWAQRTLHTPHTHRSQAEMDSGLLSGENLGGKRAGGCMGVRRAIAHVAWEPCVVRELYPNRGKQGSGHRAGGWSSRFQSWPACCRHVAPARHPPCLLLLWRRESLEGLLHSMCVKCPHKINLGAFRDTAETGNPGDTPERVGFQGSFEI